MPILSRPECRTLANEPESATQHGNRMLAMVLVLWALALGAVLVTPAIVVLS